jgi:hypothetical protein
MADTRLLQYRLDSTLRFGIVCSIVWVMGLGSLYALVCGMRARSIIKASGGRLVGMGRAKWCIVVGAAGVAIWFPILAVLVVRSLFAAP